MPHLHHKRVIYKYLCFYVKVGIQVETKPELGEAKS